MLAYLITCGPSGKRYVGITTQSVADRWKQHLKDSQRRLSREGALARAIRKYGAESFSIEPICVSWSWKNLCSLETALIAQWNTKAPNGYNLTSGGEGVVGYQRTAEDIERSAAKHRGKPCHANTRAAASRTHLGKPKSESQRAKIAAARRGIPQSIETRRKLSAAKIGQSVNAGEKNHGAKLTESIVRLVRQRLAIGETTGSIGRTLGVGYKAIWKIGRGLTWRSVR